MSDESDDDFFDRKFNITKIEKTDPPEGIEGKRPGTLQSVTEYAKEYVSNLNQRAAQGYSAYAATKRTKPDSGSNKS